MEKVGIILINYKDYANRFLVECRDSLRSLDYPKELYQVYIADNASTQQTRDYLSKIYPEAIILPRVDGNYSAANNAGIAQAKQDGCSYFVIVNMDTMVDKNWLSELVKAIESDKTVGIAQSKILLYPKTEEEKKLPKINSLGNFIHYLGFGFTNGYNQPDREVDGLPEINGYASGCSFIIKKEALEKIGGYDEEYYMYHDDVEMCWKAMLAGYKIILAPKSIIFHKYEFTRSILMVYYMERNRYLVMFHYYRWLTIILLLPAIVFLEFGVFFYSLFGKWFGLKIKANSYFLKISTWRKILAKRKQVKILRIKSDKEIIAMFAGKILFQEIDNPVLKYIANPILNFYLQLIKKIIVW
ncbi:MAG: glycosyltransferase family 2 protein [Patescibacteria group bacterium]